MDIKKFRQNTYTCTFAFIKDIEFDEKQVKGGQEYACWSKVAPEYRKTDFILIKGINNSKNEKFIETIVKIINKITPCKLHNHNKINYITIKLLKNYYAILILLNLIRLMWYSPKIVNETEYLTKICKEFEENEEVDAIELITKSIPKFIISKQKGMSYWEGDHCFFYRDIKPKTVKQLLEFDNSKKRSMKTFLCS